MTEAPKILLAHHLKTLKLPTLPHGSMRSLPARRRRPPGWLSLISCLRAFAHGVPPKGWIMLGSSPVWSSWRCPAAFAARS